MYSSKIKEIWEKIHTFYNINNPSKNSIKNKNNILNIPNIKENKYIFSPEEYQIISDFIINKFPDTSKIFSKFSYDDFFSFIYLSNFNTYKEGTLIASKDEECNSYIFILDGDINLYSEKDISSNTTILKSTISTGNIYGHLNKDKHKYYVRAKNNISIISILKPNFDELIMLINKRIRTFKPNFIKKFFPNIRMFSDDLINNILSFFERINYQKYDKILVKQNYNEYIYLIISGEVAYCLKPKTIFNNNYLNEYDYILLEKLKRGDVIGINSALGGVKNEYNCIILSDETEFYRISKGDFLYCFGGIISDSTLILKSIGDLQDMALQKKVEYLKNINYQDVNITKSIIDKFCLKIEEKNKINYVKGGMIIYEDPIDNVLFEKWKTVKLGLSDFKNKLLGQKKKRIDEIKKNNFDINNNTKDIGIIKKDQTYSLYRVTNGRLNLKLNNNQLKSLSKSNGLCGIKKNNNEDNNKTNNIKDNNNNNDKHNSKSIIKIDEDEK